MAEKGRRSTQSITLTSVDAKLVIPDLVDSDLPDEMSAVGEPFDVRIAFNYLVTGFSDNNV